METHYKLRITLTECRLTEVLSYLQNYKQYAYCFEKGKKEEHPHYHIYLVSDKKEDTIRNQLRKLSKSSKGNKLYSLVKLSHEENCYAIEYLAYMLKEGDFTNVQIPDSVIVEARAYDDQVKKELKEKKEKKKNRYTKIVVEYDGGTGFNEIYKHVTNVLLAEKSNISPNTVTSWCNTLLMNKDPEYLENQLSCTVYGQLYPQFRNR